MKTLVVYYSRSGNTKKAAEIIAQHLRADQEELIDLTNRNGFWGWLFAGRDAWRKRMTKIGPTKMNPSAYDLVILGTPMWAASITPAIRTYISQNQSKIKKVAFFITKGGVPGKNALNDLQTICGQKPVAIVELAEKELKTGEGFRLIEKFCRALS
jgi:flavodoxin